MNKSLLIIGITAAFCIAQEAKQPTIDLDAYKKNPKKYAWAETTLTVGKHQYRFVNIKPLSAGDTACISAIVLDKRKFVFPDLTGADQPHGLMIPKKQPIPDALVAFKGSPYEAKTFIMFASGKMVSLPGSSLFVDEAGSTLYCVWDNDGVFRLTLFDYARLRMLLPTTVIPKPAQWFNAGMNYLFKAAEEEAYYTVDLMTRSLTKSTTVEPGMEPVNYTVGFDGVAAKECCGRRMFSR